MKKTWIIGALLCLLPLASIAQGGPYEDHAELPDKVAAGFVEPLLEAVNSGNEEKIEDFVRESFAPSFRDHFPMEAHIGFMVDVHEESGNLIFHSSREYEEALPETQIFVILHSERLDSWMGITIHTDPDQGDLIAGMNFSPARPPSDLPTLAKLTEEEAVAELAAYVERMSEKDVFSGTVLLAKGEKVLYQDAKGLASKRFGVANNSETKFNLGSMNKMFTSVAILQLVQDGKLELGDKLSSFLDETWLPEEITEKIEIRHLLTHSSGLGSYFNQTYVDSSKNLYRALDDYKPLIENETLQFEPGTDNRYSNTGMFLLGVVIEKVTGRDYFDHIRSAVYQKAGMKNTDCYEMDQPVPNLAIGYEPDRQSETGWRNNIYLHVLKGGPAGGGFSTVGDLHRFALAVMGNELLNPAHTAQMLSPKPDLHSPEYGYGFGVGGTPENRIVGHGGGFDGINSNLDIYLDRGYIAAVMSNYGGGAGPIEMKIRELLSRVE